MSVRKYSAGLAAAAMVASGLSLAILAPASAEPTFTPDANDIVGVGSDTIEIVVDDLAKGMTIDGAHVNGWNDTHSDVRLASFDATGTSPVVLRSGSVAVTRPNGSGAGKARLYGAGNDPDVNFARSSSAINATEASNGLWAYPFAVDGLKMAVSGQTATHAPASLTGAQVLGIYNGTYTNWSQVGGTSGTIKPYIPQSGSGTRSFFESQLTLLKGSAWAQSDYAASVQETQEHSPTAIQGDADAIAPFSTARAQTLASPGAVKLEGGWSAQRAVYDVVRAADKDTVGGWASQLFGASGFFCSSDAKKIIEANGFAQLATEANGGVCGVPTQSATTNFTSNTVTTTTTLTASSPAGRQARLTATVAAGGASADGDVEFYEGVTKVGTGLLTGGQSVLTLNNVAPGSHTYTAKFVSGNPAAFTDSTSSDASVNVRETSTTTATVAPGTFGHGGTATVTVSSAAGTPTGTVTISVGGWQSTAALANGTATFSVPGTVAAGSHSFSASYAGDATRAPSNDTKVYTVGKSTVTLAKTFPAKVKAGKRGVGTIVVTIPASTVKADGAIVIKKGAKVIGKGTLVNGVAKIKLAKLPKGKNKLVATYGGSAGTLGATLTFVIVQK